MLQMTKVQLLASRAILTSLASLSYVCGLKPPAILSTRFSSLCGKLPNICKRPLNAKLNGGCPDSVSMSCAQPSSEKSESSYWQGGSTLSISKKLHVENRAKVLSHMGEAEKNSIILLSGGKQLYRADSDHELLFRYVHDYIYLSITFNFFLDSAFSGRKATSTISLV
jgi:hypothetical protein